MLISASSIALPAAFGALAFAGTLLLAGSSSGHARRLQRRYARVCQQARPDRSSAKTVAPTTVRKQEAASIFGQAAALLVVLVPRASVLRARLERAGIGLSVVDFVTFSVLAGVLTLLLGLLLVGLPPTLAAALGLIVATGGANLLIQQRIRRRNKRFLSEFPDAVDLIVRGVKSGLPVAEAIHTAAQESRTIVAEIFREVTGNIRIGLTLEQALWTASRRLQLQEFKFFVISLVIQQETGGNLSEILQNLSHMMRRREQLKLKIRAMSSEARASAMIIGSLPFIMFVIIYLINEAYIMKFFIDPRGILLLGAAIGSLLLGLGVMAKMVRFEI